MSAPREVPQQGPESRKDDGGKAAAEQSLRPSLEDMTKSPAFSQKAESLGQVGLSQTDKSAFTAKAQESAAGAANADLAKSDVSAFAKGIEKYVTDDQLDTMSKAVQSARDGSASPEIVQQALAMKDIMTRMQDIVGSLPAADQQQAAELEKRLSRANIV